jgi:hypothetical protein
LEYRYRILAFKYQKIEYRIQKKVSGAQLCEFCWRVDVGSGKSADPIFHHEPPLLKHFSDAMGDFKN